MMELNSELARKPRPFRTELPAVEYLRLELAALERGATAYKLAGSVLSAWLNGQLMLRDNANGASVLAPPLEPKPEGSEIKNNAR